MNDRPPPGSGFAYALFVSVTLWIIAFGAAAAWRVW